MAKMDATKRYGHVADPKPYPNALKSTRGHQEVPPRGEFAACSVPFFQDLY